MKNWKVEFTLRRQTQYNERNSTNKSLDCAQGQIKRKDVKRNKTIFCKKWEQKGHKRNAKWIQSVLQFGRNIYPFLLPDRI